MTMFYDHNELHFASCSAVVPVIVELVLFIICGTSIVQLCSSKMGSFFLLLSVHEELPVQSTLSQWMQITFRDLVARTSESLGETTHTRTNNDFDR